MERGGAAPHRPHAAAPHRGALGRGAHRRGARHRARRPWSATRCASTTRCGERTAIKLMTDGILLAETQGDRELRAVRHDHHRRGARAQPQHRLPARLSEDSCSQSARDLKVVITSATIDAERFSQHFGGAPVIEVSGRLYPVEVRYRPVAGDAEDTTRDEEEQALADAVDELCREGPGDMLVFLPGEREIRDAAEVLRKRRARAVEILPLYSRLSAAEQDRVFKPGRRAARGARHQRRRDLAHRAAHPLRGRHRRLRASSATATATRSRCCASSRSRRPRRSSAPAAAAASPTASASACTPRRISRKRPGVHRSGAAALLARLGDPAREEPGPRRGRGRFRSSIRRARARSPTAMTCSPSSARSMRRRT